MERIIFETSCQKAVIGLFDAFDQLIVIRLRALMLSNRDPFANTGKTRLSVVSSSAAHASGVRECQGAQ
jgi:hypothetical protein